MTFSTPPTTITMRSILAVLMLILSAVQTLRAATFTVTTTADEFDTPSGANVSLREALRDSAAASGANTVVFAAALSGATITLDSAKGQIAITNTPGAITIDASSLPGGITIDGGTGTNRVFTVNSGRTATLIGLTLTGGNGTGGSVSGAAGAVDNFGTLTLTRCSFSGNTAVGQGGAIRNNASSILTLNQCTLSGNTGSFGGGISNFGTLALTNCTLSGNTGTSSSGAIDNNPSSSVTLTHCTVSGNSAGGGAGFGGGGIDNLGTLTLNNSIVGGNTLTGAGTGADIFNETGATLTRTGANIVQTAIPGTGTVNGGGTITATNPLLGALASNGGATKTMALLTGSPALDAVPAGSIVAGLDTDQRGFHRNRDGNAVAGALPDIGAYESQAAPQASGQIQIFVTTLTDENDTNGTLGAGISLREAVRDASDGAAILFDSALNGGTITLTLGSEMVVGKSAGVDASSLPGGLTVDGGAGTNRIFTVSAGKTVTLTGLVMTGGNGTGGSVSGAAGAVDNFGTLTLTRCSFSGNTAAGAGGAIRNNASSSLTLNQCTLSGNTGGFGGGISNFGTLALTGCTLSGNTGTSSSGAIDNNPSSSVTLTHCTVSGNSAGGGAGFGGGGIDNLGTLTLNNSIVGGNTLTGAGTGADIFNETGATLTRTGANIVQAAVAGTGTVNGAGSIVTANPLLAALASNGGPTKTMALLPGSPARNTSAGSAASSDQRGFAIFGIVDIGAYEAQIAAIAGTTTNEDTATGSIAITVGSIGTLSATSSVPALVSGFAFGGSGASRTLTITPAADANGSATITVTDSLSGETQTFTLSVTPVNDAPIFTKGANQTAQNNAGAQSIAGWATGILPGPPTATDESGQMLTFNVTNDSNTLFTVQPAVSATGTLTFTPAVSASGTATVTVTLADNGSNSAPNVNTSAAQTFTITVTASIIMVTSNADSGAGTLRQALLDAAASPSANSVVFAAAVFTGPIVLSAEIALSDAGGVTIDGTSVAGGVTIDGGAGTNRIFSIPSGTSLTLRGLTLTNGNGTGALSSGSGGAIYNAGTLVMDQCTVSGNSITSGNGGGIQNAGTATVTRSTFVSNTTTFVGGGISNDGAAASLTATQCTFTANTSGGNGGGGVNNTNNGAATLKHCTVSGNSAPGGSGTGGGVRRVNGTFTLTNCIVSGNTATSSADTGGTFVQTGVNLLGGSALLAPLGGYGGPTQTMALLPGSPARNAATVLAPALTDDQRGFPIVGTPDIGAYEAGTLGTNFNAYIYESLPAAATLAQHATTFDFDSDGVSNLNEFLALTNPGDANSFLRVTQTTVSGGNLNVTFPTVAGRNYTLESRADLSQGTWTTVPGSATAGTGSPVTLPIGPLGGIPQFFVRVRVGP